MKIVSRRRTEVSIDYRLHFDRVGSPGSGLSFPCDEHGNVDVEKLAEAGRENYAACLAGTNGTRRQGVQRLEGVYRHPAVGECACGAHVVLANFTNTCNCGLDYNSSGQQLAPRSQWGEETGEHWTECY